MYRERSRPWAWLAKAGRAGLIGAVGSLLLSAGIPARADGFNLGQAGQFTVLGLSNAGVSGKTQVTVNNGSVIQGNLGVASPGKLQTSGSGAATGQIILEPGANYGGPLPITRANLDQAVLDANAAADAAAVLSPSPGQTYGILSTTTTIQSQGPVTVVALGGIKFSDSGDVLTLKGSPTDSFIVNISGDLILTHNQASIKLDGPQANNVLFNILPTHDMKISGGGPGAKLQGTFLNKTGSIVLNGNTQLTGRLIAGGDKIDLVSDADVYSNTSVVGKVLCHCPDGDEDGIAGATVELHQSATVIQTTTTGADGSYGFSGVAPGTYYVEAKKLPDFDKVSSTFNVATGTTTAVNVVLHPSLTLDKSAKAPGVPEGGNIAVPAGTPITYTFTVKNTGDVTINAITVKDSVNGAPGVVVGTSGFSLAPGAVEIITTTSPVTTNTTDQATVTGTGCCPDAVTLSSRVVSVTLLTGLIRGTVVCDGFEYCNDPSHDHHTLISVTPAPVHPFDDALVQLFRVGQMTPFAVTTTDANGKFSFPGLPAGSYNVQVSSNEHDVTTGAADVTLPSDSSTQEVNFGLKALPICYVAVEAVKGKVLFSDRTPFATQGGGLGPGIVHGLPDLQSTAFVTPTGAGTHAFRYYGVIPSFPELGTFDATRPMYVIVREPLVPEDVWNADSTSFRNLVQVQDGTGTGITRPAGPYTQRVLFSQPFEGPATAHNYSITGLTISATLTPPTFVREPSVTATPPPGTLTDIKAGEIAQTRFQFSNLITTSFSIAADGKYTDACGNTFFFKIHPDVEGEEIDP